EAQNAMSPRDADATHYYKKNEPAVSQPVYVVLASPEQAPAQAETQPTTAPPPVASAPPTAPTAALPPPLEPAPSSWIHKDAPAVAAQSDTPVPQDSAVKSQDVNSALNRARIVSIEA